MAVNGFSVRRFLRLRSRLRDQAVYKSGTLISGLLIIIIRGGMEWEGRERVAFMF